MIVRIITIDVVPGREEAFEAATRKNVDGSLAEPGVLRFDLLRDTEQRGRYYLYEAYRDKDATEEHKNTEHYAVWKASVEEMMAAPRGSVRTEVLAPIDLRTGRADQLHGLCSSLPSPQSGKPQRTVG